MASPNISFDKIPSSIRKPGKYFEFNTKLAKRSLPTNLQRVLLVAQRLASGTVPALTPVTIFSDDEAAGYFGRGSIAHRMAAAAIEANRYAQITVVAVDDDTAGVAATGTVTLEGAASSPGAVSVEIGRDRVDVVIASGMTANQAASALVDALQQHPDLPVSVVAASNVVTLTALHKGESGNAIKLRARIAQAAGMDVFAQATLSGGLNDPDLTPAFAAVFGASYEIYALPFDTPAALAALRTQLEALGHPLEQRDAIGVAGFAGTLAAATSLATDVNSGLISLAWHNKSRALPCEIAAGYAAVIASEEDPARPLNTLEIVGLDVIPVEDRPGRVEQEVALHNGVTPLEVGPGNRIQIVRAITTYLVDAQAVSDDSLLDLTTMRTLHYFRRACRERISLRFPREKLSHKTPAKVRSELLDVSYKCEELEFLHRIDEFKDRLVVEVDSQSVGQLNAAIPAPVVPGLHVFAGRIDLYL